MTRLDANRRTRIADNPYRFLPLIGEELDYEMIKKIERRRNQLTILKHPQQSVLIFESLPFLPLLIAFYRG